MKNAIARRIRKLERLEFEQRVEERPNLAAILWERRCKRMVAEGLEPEPDLPRGRPVDSQGRPLALADVLLQNRRPR